MRNNTNGYIYYDYHKKSEKEEIIETAWKSIFNWLAVIIGFLSVVTLMCSIFFRVIEVDGNSMYPTLHDGEKVVVCTFNYTPEYGDIVVAKCDDIIIVKRIIATENQQVYIDYDENCVKIDSEQLNEEYIESIDISEHDDEIEYPHIVEPGCFFLMGDNRNSSKDSRSLSIGDIDKNDIMGKVIFRLSSDFNIY